MTYQSKFQCDSVDDLFNAILQLKTLEECYSFFGDLATVPEIKSLAQRLQVAKMLLQNDTYTEISKSTGASTATISRVKNSLYYGSDGYKMILKRID